MHRLHIFRCVSKITSYINISTYVDVTNATTGSTAFIPGYVNKVAPTSPNTTVFSQIGLVLFDYDAFKSQGFTDQDADMNGQGYTSAWLLAPGLDGDGVHTEQNEETWLDNNSTALMP